MLDNKTVYYLKVNRNADYTIKCLRHWINIIDKLDSYYCIICDNKSLIKKINKLTNKNKKNYIGLIPSYILPLKKATRYIATKRWENATYAQLSTFYHSKKYNIKNFWNIDADDTMFLADAEKVAEMLNNVQTYATRNNIDAISLDMWHSRTKGKHWSWGIAFVQNKIDFFKIFNNLENNNWQNSYLDYAIDFNLDWFFTYLRDKKIANIQTFCVENLYFVHWGNFLLNPSGSCVSYWENNKIHYPLFKDFIEGNNVDSMDIAEKTIKFEVNCTLEYSKNYLINNISHLQAFPKELIRAHNLELCIDYFKAKFAKNFNYPNIKIPANTPPFKEKEIKLFGIPIYEKYFDKLTGLKEYKLFGFKHPFKKKKEKFFDLLLKKAPKDCDDIYLIRQATGESYIFANIAEELVKVNNSKKPLFFFTRKYHFDFFELFGRNYDMAYQNIHPVDFPYLDKYKYTYKNKNIYILLDHDFLLNKLLKNGGENENFDYVAEILNYLKIKNYKDSFKYPLLKKEYKDFATLYLNNLGISPKDKYVVIYEQSWTVTPMNIAFWKELELHLKHKNVKFIYNNSKLNFKEMLAICENAIAIIGSRTGALEPILPLNKKMFVLYSNAYRFKYDAKKSINTFSLKKYPKTHQENIYEYNTEEMTEKAIIENIVNNL